MHQSQAVYALDLSSSPRPKITRFWLLLAVYALACSGVYSILLVLMRTPFFQRIIPLKDFFHTALVVHVDLSVLVWSLSISAMLWSVLGKNRHMAIYRTAAMLALAGMVCIALSPFIGEALPLMNNYVPVLQNPVFFIGLALFGCGVLFHVSLTFFTYIPWETPKEESTALHYGIYYGAVITLIAFAAFVLSYIQVMRSPDLEHYDIEHFYEQVFWGGGHTLQFTYTHMMVVAWLWLASANGYRLWVKEQFINFLLSLNVMLVIPGLVIYAVYPAYTPEHIDFFTQQMRYGGGVSAAIAGVIILWALLSQPLKIFGSRVEFSALLCSILLFGLGGVLGYLISGYNVTIPAHYHGSIVGISLALMGLVYHFLPRLGYGEVKGKLAVAQPYIYAGGQLLHITGLAISGGYGALRKTPGAVASHEAQIWMGVMGLGGLIAIIGGLLFVIIAFKAIMSKPHASATIH